jgi:outer membrane protein
MSSRSCTVRPRFSILSAVFVLTAAISASGFALAETRMAVVDTQRAVMETEDGLRAQASLKKHFDERQRSLDARQNQLQKEREDLEKQKGVLSKEALATRIDKWQREMASLQTVFVDYNKELQKKQNELTAPIVQKTMAIIRRLATQHGFDMVIDKQAVPYSRSDLDLTDRVITAYNSGDVGASPQESTKKP